MPVSSKQTITIASIGDAWGTRNVTDFRQAASVAKVLRSNEPPGTASLPPPCLQLQITKRSLAFRTRN